MWFSFVIVEREKAEEGEREETVLHLSSAECENWSETLVRRQYDRLQVVYRSTFARVTVKILETLNLYISRCSNLAWHEEIAPACQL